MVCSWRAFQYCAVLCGYGLSSYSAYLVKLWPCPPWLESMSRCQLWTLSFKQKILWPAQNNKMLNVLERWLFIPRFPCRPASSISAGALMEWVSCAKVCYLMAGPKQSSSVPHWHVSFLQPYCGERMAHWWTGYYWNVKVDLQAIKLMTKHLELINPTLDHAVREGRRWWW